MPTAVDDNDDEDKPRFIRPQPQAEDEKSTFGDIFQGYGSIALLLHSEKEINQALECYRIIVDNPAAAAEFSPENTAEQLKKAMSRLRLAADYWQKEPENTNFQKDYARLLEMACADVAGPLAVIDEAAHVIHRHLSENAKPESTMSAVSELSTKQLQKAYRTLDVIRSQLSDFARPLQLRATFGNIVTGLREENPVTKRILGRPAFVGNPHYKQEVLFAAVIGILDSERNHILQEIAKMEPKAEAESLKQAFEGVTRHISDYAKYIIDDPKLALTLMQGYIPKCLKALEMVQNAMPEPYTGIMLLVSYVEQLQGMTGRSDPSAAQR